MRRVRLSANSRACGTETPAVDLPSKILLSCFYGSGLANELPPVGFEIGLHRNNAAEADGNALLGLKHPIMGERLANFHDLDVPIVQFPELTFCQRGNWRFS